MAIEAEDRPKKAVAVLSQDGFSIEQLTDWARPLPVSRRRPAWVAILVILAVFGFGGVWASTAKIGGSVNASGRVIAEGQNTVIQHLEGGIIRSISVQEGDTVHAGDIVATLDSGPIGSQLRAAQVQQALSTIELERWRATIKNPDTFELDLSQFGDVADDERVVGALKSQQDEFNSSRDVLQAQLAKLDTNINNEREDIVSVTAQLKSANDQIAQITTELTGLRELFNEGLTTRVRMSTLERTLSQLQGTASDAQGTLNKSKLNIESLEEQKRALTLQQAEEASQNISRVQSDLSNSTDQVFRLNDRLERASIKAPIDGTIIKVDYKSVGAVLPPAQTFMEIFPAGGALAVEVPLPTKDIGEVKEGQAVDITFPSDNTRTMTPLKGTVEYLSKDSFVDQTTGAAHYVVRASINPGQTDRVILPGNNAEVYFSTTPKTFLEYVTAPITRFAMRSFPG